MRILLTNDDGYQAEGIQALFSALTAKGHEVYLVAPHIQQSGKSHAMTVVGSYRLHRHSDRIWSVEGTPVDCVIVAKCTDALVPEVDLVVSGINHGYNLSTDTIYSGTCGAARQAAIYGIPAIALSQDKGKGEYDFPRLASFFASNLEKLLPQVRQGSFMNINFPPLWNGKLKKAILGRKHYYDSFSLEENEDGSYTCTVLGFGVENDPQEEGAEYPYDYTVCEEGFGSVTMLTTRPGIAEDAMEALEVPSNLD